MQHQLARAATEHRGGAAARSTTAARLRDAGLPFLTEAAMCKIFSSEVAERVASLAVNLLRRQRLRQGLPGREALSRREDRADLRRHLEPAARKPSPSSSSDELTWRLTRRVERRFSRRPAQGHRQDVQKLQGAGGRCARERCRTNTCTPRSIRNRTASPSSSSTSPATCGRGFGIF